MTTRIFNFQPGQILIVMPIILVVVMILTVSMFSSVANFTSFGSKTVEEEQASALAEAGADYAIWKINTGNLTVEEGKEVLIGAGKFKLNSVYNPLDSTYSVEIMGAVLNGTEVAAKRTIKFTAEIGIIGNANVSFTRAALVDDGGIVMYSERSCIFGSIVNTSITGNVHTNENINATQMGCPIGSGMGTIVGNADAVGTINSGISVTGGGTKHASNYPPAPSTVALPTWINEGTVPSGESDTEKWRIMAQTHGTRGCNETISGVNVSLKGYWPCGLTISSANINQTGTIFVEGKLTVNIDGKFTPDTVSYPTRGSVIVVNQLKIFGSNEFTTGFFKNPDTGQRIALVALKSGSFPSVDFAVKMGDAGGQTASLLWAPNGYIQNNGYGKANALIAKQLIMGDAFNTFPAKLEFISEIGSLTFGTAPGEGLYTLKPGTFRYSK